MSFPGGIPSPYHNTSTGTISFLRGYPSHRQGVPSGQVRMGRGPHQPGMGYPPGTGTPLLDRTAGGVLATRRAVCLLCSRRRTFLLYIALNFRLNRGLWFVIFCIGIWRQNDGYLIISKADRQINGHTEPLKFKRFRHLKNPKFTPWRGYHSCFPLFLLIPLRNGTFCSSGHPLKWLKFSLNCLCCQTPVI